MNKKKLIEQSVSYFEEHDIDEIHATTDGQFFFDENRAQLHKKSKRNPVTGKDKITVYTISREEALTFGKPLKNEKPDFLKLGVREITEALKTKNDLDELREYLEVEKSNEPRSTAITAIENRIAELEKTNA